MPPSLRIVFGLTVIGLTLQPASIASAKPREDETSSYERIAARTKRAAQEVLKAVLRDDRIKLTPCQFTTQWSSDPVGFEVAREYLGSHLHADLVAPHSSTQPSDLIDPDGKMRGNFCTDNHASALWLQMVADFRSGAREGEPDVYNGKPNGTYRLSLERTDMAMPVFNQTFTAAVIKVYRSATEAWRISKDDDRVGSGKFDKNGHYKHSLNSGIRYTYAYRLTKRGWKRVLEREDAYFD